MLIKIIQENINSLSTIDEKVEFINSIKLAMHDLSPMKTEPVDCVIWVKNNLVHSNDYNPNGIPDEAPKILEDKQWAPSWRRMCKVLLRNDHWCKGLGLTQPKSEAYGKYLEIKKNRAIKDNNNVNT